MLTNASLAVFALLPLNTIVWSEVSIVLLAGVAAILATLDWRRSKLGTGYGFLLTGVTALYTGVAFVVSFADDYAPNIWIPTTFALATFATTGIGLHMVQDDHRGDDRAR